MFSQQDYVRSAQGGGGYPTNMPPELMQNPYSRLPYGQQGMGMGMYTQNQPLPPGRFMAHSSVAPVRHTFLAGKNRLGL